MDNLEKKEEKKVEKKKQRPTTCDGLLGDLDETKCKNIYAEIEINIRSLAIHHSNFHELEYNLLTKTSGQS